MRLDPEHSLAPATVHAMRDLLQEGRTTPDVDDRDLLQIALGVADPATRRACARAVLDRPDTRHRLLRIRASVRDALDESMTGESGEALVLRWLNEANRIDRLIAEGWWTEAMQTLRRSLPMLRTAWNVALALNLNDTAERFVRTLLVPLLEAGTFEDFDELIRVGTTLATRLRKPGLRSWLLSYDGAAAARRADSAKARALWTERAILNREIDNPVAEVDSLLDIASQAFADGDFDVFRSHMDQAERLLPRADRAALTASFWSMSALESLRLGDPEGATLRARTALDALANSTEGADTGLFVRISLAQTLVACDRTWEALDALTETLTHCVEAGRAFHAAAVLGELAGVLEKEGRPDLSERALETALGVHRHYGTRHIEATVARVTVLRARYSQGMALPNETPRSDLAWEEATLAILGEISRERAATNAD